MSLPFFTGVANVVRKLKDQWGREADQSSWSWGRSLPPQDNPDETTSDTYYDLSLNPQVVAGMAFSDVSQLAVSARGIKDDDGNELFPPQLRFTTPELAGDDILELVGWQFDEEFEGGFSEVIRSTDNPCKSYGRCILEYEWYIREADPHKGKAFVKQVWSRDPEKYRFDQDGKPGIYLKTGYNTWKRMNPQNFQSYAYNPLFNNPYGQSINLPLKPWLETFVKFFGYWRHAIEKAGMGSWVAYGPDSWFSGKNNVVGQEMISVTIDKLKKIASGTYTLFPASAELKNEKLQIEAQAFLDWYTAFCEVVSLVYTGTTGALKEEEYGSRAAKESTDVREKSQKEKFNAARVSAFWTWQFIPLLVNVNFPPSQIRSYPTYQLIPPNLITPTTPEGQDTQEEITEKQGQEQIEVRTKKEEKTEEEREMMGIELQEDDEDKPYTPPPAIPPSYEDFPSTEPLPEGYQEGLAEAQAYLRDLPVKNYPDVQPDEAHQVFTIKKLRSFEQAEQLLRNLKQAIVVTLDAATEQEAWEEFWQDAIVFFQDAGIEQPSPELRSSLIASFRQARQNALNEGLYQSALQDDSVVGLRIVNNPNVKQHHLTHPLWHNIALPKDHPELQVGGRLRIPMDFGCVCSYEKVYKASELTPENEWPDVYPGDTYQYYAQPEKKEEGDDIL